MACSRPRRYSRAAIDGAPRSVFVHLRVLLPILLALAATPLAAPAQSDTTRRSADPLFTRRDAVVGAAFVVGTVALLPFDKRLSEQFQRPSNHPRGFVASLDSAFRLTAAPGALLIGGTMYAVGRIAHIERAADLGLHGTEALLVGSAVGGLIKGTLGRARPYAVKDSNAYDFKLGRGFTKGSPYSSLPSGHTAAAFAAAAAVTAETSKWWPHQKLLIGTAMYGGATMVALSRMYDDKHWASDVVLGAAIGTFSGWKVVQYHHSHPGNRIDRWLLSATVTPAPDGGLVMAWTIAPR
ncbi:MAG TPA: phosphatase PAP2 family protein [Gemmatimonadaceae bacterium]|nr:phosphatase PAP2 family protein [Gemmatimonadaceae bacterium]